MPGFGQWDTGKTFKNENFKRDVSKGKEPSPGGKRKSGAYMNAETSHPGGEDRQ